MFRCQEKVPTQCVDCPLICNVVRSKLTQLAKEGKAYRCRSCGRKHPRRLSEVPLSRTKFKVSCHDCGQSRNVAFSTLEKLKSEARRYKCGSCSHRKLPVHSPVPKARDKVEILCELCSIKLLVTFNAITKSKLLGRSMLCTPCKLFRGSNPNFRPSKPLTPEYRKELHLKYRRQYRLDRRATDPEYKLLDVLRSRLYTALKGNVKSDNTIQLLGCSVSFLREYLAVRFLPGMTWENHGKYGWHVDHIRPCSSFNLSDPQEQQECFNYTNLQPLWAADNLEKYSKWNPVKGVTDAQPTTQI